jgi:hypothetical protein
MDTAERWSIGDSWIAVRASDPASVATAYAQSRRASAAPTRMALRDAFEIPQEGRAIVLPARAGWVLIAPGVVSPEWLVAFSARLATEVYAFEAHWDHGCAVMFANGGKLIRDAYACRSAGEYRDEGEPLDGEPADPMDPSPDGIVDFATARTTESAWEPATEILCLKW